MENLKQNKKELWIMLGGVTIILGGVVFYKFYYKKEDDIPIPEKGNIPYVSTEIDKKGQDIIKTIAEIRNERIHPREGKEEL